MHNYLLVLYNDTFKAPILINHNPALIVINFDPLSEPLFYPHKPPRSPVNPAISLR